MIDMTSGLTGIEVGIMALCVALGYIVGRKDMDDILQDVGEMCYFQGFDAGYKTATEESD
jgi:hypothetical protein